MERAIVNVVKKLYTVHVISSHHHMRGNPDKFEIPIVVTFIPKEKTKFSPDILIVSSRFILGEPDSSGERPLFPVSNNLWVHDENMPMLEYFGEYDTFTEYCLFLFKKEAEKVASEIDPDWNKYGSN